jgi:hypothetical protein
LLEIDIVLQIFLDVRSAPRKPLFGSAASFSPAGWTTSGR